MMLTPTTNARMRLSYLALIPLLAIFVYACNPSKNNKVPAPAAAEETEAPAVKAQEAPAAEAIPFEAVETKPGFNGGDADEFSKWVNSQLTYPEAAKEAGTQGRVMIQFTVNADGSMSDFKVVRSASPELDAEALRVLTSCTQKWTPGIQDGKPVPVTYNFPIIFQLR